MAELSFERYVGRLVKVVYREEPDGPIQIRKGRLVGCDGEFIEVRSFENTHLISRRSIISLKVFGEGLNSGGK
jgi:ribosome maturation factor RimP